MSTSDSESDPVGSRSVPSGHLTYAEPLRPQFHFSPPKNWINDPNGLVYHEGEIPSLLSTFSLKKRIGGRCIGVMLSQ